MAWRNDPRFGTVELKSYTVATMPDPTTIRPGTIAFVSDADVNGGLAFCDGTIWRNVNDGLLLA